ncbi:BLUF domain-containing protein [Curtobacterium sp. ZW137]|uniref:BLUF domain-containing protein n=1 Tax=Curtobacterium sp. ZW137 TaxID=2485104 RepID=UPI0021A41788|nr:BLUF domain-containing protein [Curtobacterium sp. ZW137]
MYMSAATVPFNSSDLDEVLRTARHRNAEAGLSGLLIFKDGRFMQLLEGPREAVLERYARIVDDPRHTDVGLLVEENIHTRRFADWSMAFHREADGALPEGFSTFLTGGDTSADHSRSRELLRWFRNHPFAVPTPTMGERKVDEDVEDPS